MRSILGAACVAFVVLFAPIALGGCTTIGKLFSNEQTETYDEKALITAELAYSFVLGTTMTAAQTGALDAEEAAQIRPIIEQANLAILRARAAYAAGERLDASIATRDLVGQVAAAVALLEQFGLLQQTEG